jgi:hypothetical protein
VLEQMEIRRRRRRRRRGRGSMITYREGVRKFH